MSLSSVRPLFRTRLKGLGFKEHKDAFNFDNIAASILDNSFHLESPATSGFPTNQRSTPFDYSIVVRVFRRGFNKPGDALDALDQTAQDILVDLLSSSVKSGSDIKNIEINSIERTPLDGSNDNSMILEMTFTAKLIECFS